MLKKTDAKKASAAREAIVPSDQELTARAMRAYFTNARREGKRLDQPSKNSGVEKHGGKAYVVLNHANGILAVYRVRNDGLLKRLKRWPESIKA